MKIKIAVVHANPTVGDLDGNYQLILKSYFTADDQGADLVVMPECVLTGYPLEDLVLRASFIEAVNAKVSELVRAVKASGRKAALIFGSPLSDLSGCINNAAILVDPTTGKNIVVVKSELPNYGVFDEKRVFSRSEHGNNSFEWRGYRLGLMICEDAWFPTVSENLRDTGAAFLIAINGSPFEAGKTLKRQDVIRARVTETGLPFLYVNMLGGQDELVFDGGSYLVGKEGTQFAPRFVEGVGYFETDLTNTRDPVTMAEGYVDDAEEIGEVYQACVLGLRDYMRKQGFQSVVLGYSGGVDSGLVAALAADAIGPQNVHLVRLPSKYSSQGSLDDAEAGSKRLGAPMRTIGIEGVVDALRDAYYYAVDDATGEHTRQDLKGVADENIQARARGNILMAISNQEGHLLLTTGNKSEVSVGYSTLYGDMSGGFNPIKDCYKTMVWAMCRWRNELYIGEIRDYGFLGPEAQVVPEEIIAKPPSAELRPDQKDEDSLPPYAVLDDILMLMIEGEMSRAEIIALRGYAEEVVNRVRHLIDRAEYKRRQAAPGVKITSKIHGRDRRYPIVNSWR